MIWECKMRTLQTVGIFSLFILAILGAVVDFGYVFYCIFDTSKTEDIFNISNQTPVDLKQQTDLTEDEVAYFEDRKLFEVNLFSNVETKKNDEKTGVILQELKLNYFTDQTLKTNTAISTGMQYVSDYNGKQGLYTSQGTYAVLHGSAFNQLMTGSFDALGKTLNNIAESSGQKKFENEEQANNYVSPDFNYYEKIGNGVTWNAKGLQTQLNRKTEYIVKIDDEAYKIRLDGYEDTRWDNRPNGWKDWYKYLNVTTWNDYGGKVDYYNWDMVFEDIMHAVLTNDMQTGTHYGVVNLSKYFTVTQHFNAKDNKWYPASDADQQVAYAVVKFNYNTKGAISNKQSIFGIIADDSRFNLEEVTYETDYGQHNVILELTTASLDKRYSAIHDGYLLSMSLDLQRQLKAMPPYRINITLDLSQKIDAEKIIGLDINAFDGFELEKLTIIGNQEFYLLDNSLRDTNLITIDIAETVSIINQNSGVEL